MSKIKKRRTLILFTINLSILIIIFYLVLKYLNYSSQFSLEFKNQWENNEKKNPHESGRHNTCTI